MNILFSSLISAPIIVFLLGGGCTKKFEADLVSDKVPGNLIIQGQITTNSGTEPVANQAITVYWVDRNLARRKKTTLTDSKGNYYFRVFARKDESNQGAFRLVFPKLDNRYLFFAKGNDEDERYFFNSALPRDTSIVVNYNLPSKVFLKLTFSVGTLAYPHPIRFQLQVNGEFHNSYDTLPTEQTLVLPENTNIRIVASIVNANTGVSVSSKVYEIEPIRYQEQRQAEIRF